ncbi:hypothetical protein NEAUS06_1972 [Nematocida ausubeli]|nr:hypothetical protein NEAUS06_1972 [Nematocida ausubeli]
MQTERCQAVAQPEKTCKHLNFMGIGMCGKKLVATCFIIGITAKAQIALYSVYLLSIIISNLVESVENFNIYFARTIPMAGLVVQIFLASPKGFFPVSLALISLVLIYIKIFTINDTFDEYNSVISVGVTIVLFMQLDMILNYTLTGMDRSSAIDLHNRYEAAHFILTLYLGMLMNVLHKYIYNSVCLLGAGYLFNILNLIMSCTFVFISYTVCNILYTQCLSMKESQA